MGYWGWKLMDIKKIFLEMINSKAGRISSYQAVEKLIITMLDDYLQQQGKQLEVENAYKTYDLFLPDGIDDFSGKIAVEIKMFRNSYNLLDVINRAINSTFMMEDDIDALLFICASEVSEKLRLSIEKRREQISKELLIWDINNLVDIFRKNEDLFIETYNNINAVLLQDTISSGIARTDETYLEKRKKYMEELHSEYENDNIVLFLGAGASKGANIATWDSLISELFVALIDKKLSEKNIHIPEHDKNKIVKEVINQNGNSPLLQTRFLRNGFEKDFEELVSEILYKDATDSSDLLEEIGQLCIPNRGKLGIRAIINYNFDDLIEKNLRRLRVKYHSIYGEGMIPASDELGIYHVHGFLPQNKEGYENLTRSLLVFSEEGYHKLMLEPYNWANITQLNFMMNNTCVFIGLSMTDPNMRRLLEIAAQKRTDENEACKHYAIMRRFNVKEPTADVAIKSFEKVNESLQESFFKEIGVNVIWIDEFAEIPILLKQIKD